MLLHSFYHEAMRASYGTPFPRAFHLPRSANSSLNPTSHQWTQRPAPAVLFFPLFCPSLWCSGGMRSIWQQLGPKTSGDMLLVNKEQNNLFLFFPFPWLPLLVSAGFLSLLCLESSSGFSFHAATTPVPSVSGLCIYPGRVYGPLPLPCLEQPLLFTSLLLFTSWSLLASPASAQARTKTTKDLKTLHKHTISAHPLPSLPDLFIFSISRLVYMYIYLISDGLLQPKKGVNNAALNYKNEYLKMKPALAEPSESRCSIMRVAVIYDLLIKIPWWRKDAVIGRQERCRIVYGFWTFVLVLEAWT